MQDISKETITLAAVGDLAAFEEVYKHTSGFVYNVALRLLGEREDAQEISQDVFITIYKKLNTYRFESSLKTWIYRITFNLAVNRLKKRNKERQRMIPYEDAIGLPWEEENFKRNEDGIFQADNEKLIDNLLGALNPDQRACIILRNLQGLSYQEIAEALKININTVRTRLKRARERLIALRNMEAKNEV